MSINTIGSNIPIQVNEFGGTGNNSFTQYGILYGNNTSSLGVTSAGSATQILTSNGTSAPTFQNSPNIGSGLEYVTTIGVPAVSSATVISSGYASNYNTYLFIVRNFNPGAPAVGSIVALQLSTNGGTTWLNNSTPGVYTSLIPFYTPASPGLGSSWSTISAFGYTATPGGLSLGNYQQYNGSSTIWLRGIMTNANPTTTGIWEATQPSGTNMVMGYYWGRYNGSPIVVNMMRIVNQGMTGASGNIDVYRVQTS